jgi:hypothetical protein
VTATIVIEGKDGNQYEFKSPYFHGKIDLNRGAVEIFGKTGTFFSAAHAIVTEEDKILEALVVGRKGLLEFKSEQMPVKFRKGESSASSALEGTLGVKDKEMAQVMPFNFTKGQNGTLHFSTEAVFNFYTLGIDVPAGVKEKITGTFFLKFNSK